MNPSGLHCLKLQETCTCIHTYTCCIFCTMVCNMVCIVFTVQVLNTSTCTCCTFIHMYMYLYIYYRLGYLKKRFRQAKCDFSWIVNSLLHMCYLSKADATRYGGKCMCTICVQYGSMCTVCVQCMVVCVPYVYSMVVCVPYVYSIVVCVPYVYSMCTVYGGMCTYVYIYLYIWFMLRSCVCLRYYSYCYSVCCNVGTVFVSITFTCNYFVNQPNGEFVLQDQHM